jgi:hypothetical protein
MSRRPPSFKTALAALHLSLIVGSAAVAAETGKPIAIPLSAEPAQVEFLLTSAANDFKALGSDRPTAIRNARIGFLRESNKGNYLLCGSFKSGSGVTAKWTAFATIKTSDYEQWLGGTAQAFCGQKNVKWYPGNHAATLMRRLAE